MTFTPRDLVFKFIGRTIPHRWLPREARNPLTRRLFFLSDKPAYLTTREVFHGADALLDDAMRARLADAAVRQARSEIVSTWESPEILFDYAVAIGATTMVELGTRGCNSTQALVRAASQTGGHVYSFDPMAPSGTIDPRYHRHWTFHQCTGEEGYASWDRTRPVDLLFVDTDPHSYEQTAMWLRDHWIRSVRGGGLVLFDDAAAWIEFFGVNRACREFVEQNRHRLRFAVLEACRPPAGGLFVIQLAEPIPA
ncbi:MAG: class I SAM-dependent methyltransferase [Myxococcota bacterium]